MTARTDRLTYGFVAKATLVVIAIWALAQGLWLARDVAFITFAAILLAVLLSIGVDRLEAVMPRWVAAVLVFLLFLGALFAVGFLGWPALEGQVATIREEVPRLLGDAVEWVRRQYEALMPPAAESAARSAAQEPPARGQGGGMGSDIASMLSGALPLLNTAIGAFSGLLVILFAGLFLVIDPDAYLDGALRLVPPEGRDRVRRALVDTGQALKRWLAGMSIGMVVIFAATTAGLFLLGVPAPIALGLIAGFLVFIPFIGPLLSSIPALALAFTVSPVLALWTAVLYFGVQLLESNFITPLVMKEAVNLQPAATILFQILMGVLFGFPGIFLAVPIFAALQVLVRDLYIEPVENG